jgi:hypothetical protein
VGLLRGFGTVVRARSFRQSAGDPDCHLIVLVLEGWLRFYPASPGFQPEYLAVTLLFFTPLLNSAWPKVTLAETIAVSSSSR